MQSLFDYEYYKAQNEELVSILGDDPAKLFEHFYKCGIFEGRTCNPNFDPAAYASAYSDLKDSFGTNVMLYYTHFVKFAEAENRTITTVAACANAGITVQGLVGDDVKISPSAYLLAEKLGTTDYATVQNAMNQAVSEEAQSKAESSTSSGVIATAKAIDPIVAKVQGLKLVESVSVSSPSETGEANYLYLYVVKADSDYAAYSSTARFEYSESRNPDYIIDNLVEVYKTDGYKGKDADEKEVLGNFILGSWAKGKYDETARPDIVAGTGNPYYDNWKDVDGTYSETGNDMFVNWYTILPRNGGYQNVRYNSEEGTEIVKQEGTLAGTYIPTHWEKQPFSDEEEKEQYKEEYKKQHGYDVPENRTRFIIQDSNGDENTTYDVGLKIVENEEGNTEITLGISNADDNFGYVKEYEIERVSY